MKSTRQAAVGMLLAALFVAALSGCDSDQEPTPTPTPTIAAATPTAAAEPSPEVEPATATVPVTGTVEAGVPTAAVNITPLATPPLGVEPSPAGGAPDMVIIEVGQAGSIAGVLVTFNGLRHTEEGATPPSEGNEYIVLTLTFENTTSAPVSVGGPFDEVKVFDDRSSEFGDTGMADLTLSGYGANLAVDGITIEPGGTHTGELGLEVPKESTGLVVNYHMIWPTASGEITLKLDR